jgi:hypothetical protein
MEKTDVNNHTTSASLAIFLVATAVVMIGGLAVMPTTMQSASASHGEPHGSGGNINFGDVPGGGGTGGGFGEGGGGGGHGKGGLDYCGAPRGTGNGGGAGVGGGGSGGLEFQEC